MKGTYITVDEKG